MRTFILLTAVPGAGKSTWAARYAKEHDHVYIVNSDEVRKEVAGSYRNFSMQDKVWATFRERIHDFAKKDKNAIVIADGVNDTNQIRLFYRQETPEFERHVMVYIIKPLDVLQRQNKERDLEKQVPPEVVESFYKRIEEPSSEVKHAYDECFVIS
ncbi:MAG: ATP-binding protein [Firmicutes bacterium]|nr:ATP-binding protein [Bacillota bacterium]